MENTNEVTSGEAAMILNVTSDTVRNLALRGQLKFRRQRGNHVWWFDLDSVNALAAHRREHFEPRGRRNRIRDLVTQVRLAGERTQVATSARPTRQHHPRLEAKVDPRAVDGLSPSGGMPIDVHFRQKS
jgi:phage terminase Nu1 subunit (DNA packaging protein)